MESGSTWKVFVTLEAMSGLAFSVKAPRLKKKEQPFISVSKTTRGIDFALQFLLKGDGSCPTHRREIKVTASIQHWEPVVFIMKIQFASLDLQVILFCSSVPLLVRLNAAPEQEVSCLENGPCPS